MKTRLFFSLFLLLLPGWTIADMEAQPRNVRLRGRVLGDSLSFRIQWSAPPRDPGQTPIEGYQWELWNSASPGGLDSLQSQGMTPPQPRMADVVVPVDCSYPITYYTARVRAVGSFSAAAPWGLSEPFELLCDDSPPGPPVVELDTIPLDTIGSELDSLTLGLQFLGAHTSQVDGGYHFERWGGSIGLCAVGYRDGEALRVAREDLTAVTLQGTALSMRDNDTDGGACWVLVARANGPGRLTIEAGGAVASSS